MQATVVDTAEVAGSVEIGAHSSVLARSARRLGRNAADGAGKDVACTL